MFENTFAIFRKIIKDIKGTYQFVKLSTFALYIAYLGYSLIVDRGILWLNIALLSLSAIYFVYYIVNIKKRNKETKTVTKIYSAAKILLNGCTLAFTVYSLYSATADASPISLVIALFMAIGWVAQILLQALSYYIDAQFELIKEAVHADFEKLIKPIEGPVKLVNKIRGKEEDDEKKESPYRKVINRITAKDKAERAAAREEKRQKKKEEKEARKASKK